MATLDEIRIELIGRILTLENKEFLLRLQSILSSKEEELANGLSDEQIEMLKMSEMDIESGDLISQEALGKRNLEWLNQ